MTMGKTEPRKGARPQPTGREIHPILGVILVWLLGVSMTAAAPPAKGQPVNLQQMRNEIQIFEAILDETLNQVFANPFALVERVRGVYLSEYGPTFTFQINIKAATMETPFGTIHRPETADPKVREQKLDELRQRVIDALAGHANAIN